MEHHISSTYHNNKYVVVVVVIFFQYNESIDIVDELVLNRNSMIHRLMMTL